MPIIQLLRPEATAKPGAPVLDTQRRPTVNNGAVASAVGELANAQRQPGVPMELAKNGLGAVGDALAQAGSVIGALAIKRKQAESDIQIAEADAAMTVKMSDFDRIKAENPNPAKWEPEFRKGFVEFREGLLANEDLNDGAREAIKLRLVRFEGQALASVASQATTKTFGLAQSATQANLDRYTEAQDEAGFVQTLDHGAKSGYLFPHQVEAAKQQFQREGERKQLKAKADALDAAENDVITFAQGQGEAAAIDHIDSLPFEASKKETLKNIARRTSRTYDGQAQDFVLDGITSGDIKTGERIDEIAQGSAHLSPRVVESMKAHLAKKQVFEMQNDPASVAQAQAEISTMIREYDRKDDEDGMKALAIKQEIGLRLTDDSAGYMKQILWSKYNDKPAKFTVPQESKAVLDDALNVLFDPVKGSIPWKAVPLKWVDSAGKKHETFDDAEAKSRAVDAEQQVRMKFTEWARLNPDDARDPAKIRAQVLKEIPDAKKASFLEGLQKKLPQRTSAISPRGFEPVDIAPKLPVALRPHAQDFLDAAKEYGLNPRFLAAVSALETGGGTSRAFREKNNAMGISDNSGPVAMDSVRDSIFKQAKTLARADGPYRNAQTIDEIGAIYAPPGASNDPRGTNGGWSDGVKAWLARI